MHERLSRCRLRRRRYWCGWQWRSSGSRKSRSSSRTCTCGSSGCSGCSTRGRALQPLPRPTRRQRETVTRAAHRAAAQVVVLKNGQTHGAREAHLDWLLAQEAERTRFWLTLRRRTQKLSLVPVGQAARDQELRERALRIDVGPEVESARQVRRLLQQHRVCTACEQHGVNKDAELLRTKDAVHRRQMLPWRVRRGADDEDARLHLGMKPTRPLQPAERCGERR